MLCTEAILVVYIFVMHTHSHTRRDVDKFVRVGGDVRAHLCGGASVLC